ncbi:MAG: cupin domain-containing protein [Actinobacteria bacterium]|jgi:quercetin dioxygenase-like cupin family protein|nr:cupin domain-containing protein [Actinomycetota bacterium]
MADADRYFAQQSGARPEGEGTFVNWGGLDPIEVVPGLRFQPVLGDRLMVNIVSFAPNTVAPVHWHDEEQISFVIEGEFEFEVGGQKQTVTKGGAVHIPPNVPHGARTYDKSCVQVDVFNPPRKGLLELMGLIGADGERTDR